MTASTVLLDQFRRDKARGVNSDIDLTLRPAFRDLLAKLGDPQTKLPPVFHVAGTNGKGSTCAFLRAMLEAAGNRVHVYTSPHLVRFHERIRVAGELIDEVELAAILGEIAGLSAAGSITYFEAATAAAFTAFARHPADFTIIEVGLGGRLDATNVIPQPVASIITRLSLDHRDYLGATMAAIAREKAGIMKAGVPCFAAAQPDEDAARALREAATAMGVPLFMGGEAWRVQKTMQGFHYTDATHALDLPPPSLLGDHQYDNAGLAVAALLGVGAVSRSAIDSGLRNATWPARLQKLTHPALPEGYELWLDGGHNDSAGEALAKQAAAWAKEDTKNLYLICGMLTTKHPAEFLSPLRPYVAGMQTVAIPDDPASFTAADLAKVAHAMGMKNLGAAADVETALRAVIAESPKPVRILICGSLYLAGDVLRRLDAR